MSNVAPQTWAGLPNSHLNFFKLFPRLPVDIRLLIWELVCRQGRVVTVFPRGKVLAAQDSQGNRELNFYVFKSCDPIPAILHTNCEARDVARQSYELAFDTRAEFPLITTLDTGTAGCIWINPLCDLICPISNMTDDQFDALNAKMYRLKVERIGLSDCAWQRSASIACNKWGTFTQIAPPEWMNENIKEVTLYTSRQSLFPYEKVKLTEFDYTTANLTPSLKRSKLSVMRRHNAFFEGLRKSQRLRLREDARNAALGRDSIRIDGCPQWLYDCRSSWLKPKQRTMMANVT